MKTPGQTAHDAYHRAHGDGPFDWDHVSAKDKQAWEAAAQAVRTQAATAWKFIYHDDDPPPFWKPDYHGLLTE